MANSQPYSLIDTDCIPERDNETDFAEWFEDASDVDLSDTMRRGSPAPSIADEPNNYASCCLLEDFYEKNKTLDRQCKEVEQNYQHVLLENRKLNVQLSNERHRSNRFHRKFQYIQENYEVFTRLKQAYLNMKYNQTAGKPMVEIREKACQTWQGIICASCIETAEAKRQAELARLCTFTGSEPDMITVKRSDLARLQETVQKLKDKVDERELSWSYNEDREKRYKNIISSLQNTIRVLNGMITNNHDEGELSTSSDSSLDTLQKENGLLGKIIVKLEKRQREMEKTYKPEKRIPLLNAQEKTLVQLLSKRYAQKLQQKLRKSLPCDSNTLSIQKNLMAVPHTSRTEIPEPNLISQNGGGEGSTTMFMVPFAPLHSTGNYTEEAEKPMSPKKEETAPGQVDLIDFSDDVNSN